MLTEEEAQEKICQQTFVHHFSSKCIGADCMAWRWLGYRLSGEMPSPAPAVMPEPNPEYQHRVGYCGLAGKP